MISSETDPRKRQRFFSRPEGRVLLFGLPVAVGAGILLATILSHPAEASTPQTSTKVFMAEVRPGASLEPRDGALITQPNRPQRFAVWSQAVYEGDVDKSAVEALIAAGRAESLEALLCPALKEELRKRLFDMDQQIIEVGTQYYDEFQRVAAQLRKSNGVVIIRTHPREKDDLWPTVDAMYLRMKKREGLVHSSYQPSLAPAGWEVKHGEVPMAFVFAAWKEWPIWCRLKEKYDLMLYQRVLQSRRWIAAEYDQQGMTIFQE